MQPLHIRPAAPQEPNPLGSLLAGFIGRNNEIQAENRESDALAQITKQYKNDGQNLMNKIEAINADKRLRPTTKAKTVEQLLQFSKYNNELQEKVQKQAKEKEKEEANKAQVDYLASQRGVKNPEVINAYKNDPRGFERDTRPPKEGKNTPLNPEEEKKIEQALDLAGATPEQKELYKIASTGGKTKVVQDVIETAHRNETPDILKGKVDYDSKLTPKERVKRQDQRFSVQTPLVLQNSKELNSLKHEELSLDLIDELTDSPNVGEGIRKLNINPKTGDLIIPQLASPEEQLLVKTVNDFSVKAKDSFGANVTNFELDRFMQRIPSLANSKEGRKLIVRQMKIINEINQMEKKAIQNVFDEYGVRNIDYVKTEKIDRKNIEKEKEELRKEYTNLEHLARKDESNYIDNLKKKLKPGYSLVRKPDGTFKQYPNENIPNILDKNKGYQKL